MISDDSSSKVRIPVDIRLHKKSAILELVYADDTRYELTAEYLRVHSPSADVRGHGRGQEVLQTGKKFVGIRAIEPVGNYAVRLFFDDGHDTGIYSWDYLDELGANHADYWRGYLAKLKATRSLREPLPPGTQVVTIEPLKPREPSDGQS
jgi:DUF971 family protein